MSVVAISWRGVASLDAQVGEPGHERLGQLGLGGEGDQQGVGLAAIAPGKVFSGASVEAETDRGITDGLPPFGAA